MKSIINLILASILLTSCSREKPKKFETEYHSNHQLEIELTSMEYEKLLSRFSEGGNLDIFTLDPEDQFLNTYLAYGKRNLDWINVINQNRPADKKISLSSEATTTGATVYHPGQYNFQTITQDWDILKSLLPQPLKDVIFNGAPLTSTLPINERDFTAWMLQVDKAYQSSSRYKLLKPYKDYYKLAQSMDVRGYLFFKDRTNADRELSSWNSLTLSQKDRYKIELVRLCMNAEVSRDNCIKEMNQYEKNTNLVGFKAKYILNAQNVYNSFFKMQGLRTDIQWNSSNPDVLKIPFTDPKNDEVKDYLKTNIEDEWQWNNWGLKLDFVSTNNKNTTHVEFVPGSTPHVDKLGGSTITMDANAPLTEYDVQWTIRHEYGHVLGFPDCYIEFYDEAEEAFVNYQLDVTDLMCSRRGHLKQRHFDELKRVYFKP